MIKNEKEVSPEAWNNFLQNAHLKSPSMTPRAFSQYKTKKGLSSYEMLSQVLTGNEKKILDLACGDGFLFSFISKQAPQAIYSGLDMSEGELQVARKNVQGKNVEFINSMAQLLPFENNSLDAILCHMALMLMMPLDGVIQEIDITLKVGGIFAAVVGRPSSVGQLCFELQKTITQFIRNSFAIKKLPHTGDQRSSSIESLSLLFPNSHYQVNTKDFDLEVEAPVEDIILQWRDMYFVSALPDNLKDQLLNEIRNLLLTRKNHNDNIIYSFPMRLLSFKKISQ